MRGLGRFAIAGLVLAAAGCLLGQGRQTALSPPMKHLYFGFDKDGYPGDDLLPVLRKDFAYTGYWLNDPPGMKSNPWEGKRGVVYAAGFGFLLLFNGRLDAEILDAKNQGRDAAALGRDDAAAAAAAAGREGFPAGAVIFLDQEEGGRLLAEQAEYVGAWIAAVDQRGYRAGVYGSGIPVPAGGSKMSTAQDVAARFPQAVLWVWNDRCPPAPGCAVPGGPMDPAQSGSPRALVWQYAQSPRRPEDTGGCRRTYAADGRCYAPGMVHSEGSYVDLDVSLTPDPSRGR